MKKLEKAFTVNELIIAIAIILTLTGIVLAVWAMVHFVIKYW